MDKHKQLVATVKTNIYQREKLVDKVQFLFPEFYEDLNIAECKAILKYVDQANISHAEILQKDTELYKGHIRFYLPVDTNLTQFSGDIHIRITLTKIDMETNTQYVLHTGELVFTVKPLKDYYSFVPDESLEFVDQLIGNLEAKIEATDKIAEIYDKEKADNITYDNNKIQLTSNGEKIGNSITIISDEEGNPGIVDTEFDVVEF